MDRKREIPIVVGGIYQHWNGIRMKIIRINYNLRLKKTYVAFRFTNDAECSRTESGMEIGDFAENFMDGFKFIKQGSIEKVPRKFSLHYK